MYYDPFTVELYINKILRKRLINSFPNSYFPNEDEQQNSDPVLGKYYGYYENNDSGDERICFYDEGIIFHLQKEKIYILYVDIKAIALDDGKQSLALLLTLKDQSILRLPTKHRNSKFLSVFPVDAFLRSAVFDVKR